MSFPDWAGFTPEFAAAELPRLIEEAEKAVAAIETAEPEAVYQLLYGDFGLWVHPAKMFFEEVEVNGRRMRRFEQV